MYYRHTELLFFINANEDVNANANADEYMPKKFKDVILIFVTGLLTTFRIIFLMFQKIKCHSRFPKWVFL